MREFCNDEWFTSWGKCICCAIKLVWKMFVMCESFYFEIFLIPSELAYLQGVISVQDRELYTKIYSSWKSALKMGVLSSFCFLFLTDFLSDNIEVATERSTNHLWLWKAFEARVIYCLWKNQFIKTKLKLRQEARFLVGTSVSWWPKGSSQSWLYYKIIIKVYKSKVFHHSF